MVSCALTASAGASADLRNFEDAALHAVQFVDENEGWAVGDEGVVWHTVDGGHNWERQPTGVRASLRSVCFLNPYTGWIAGREDGADSAGVLLFTRDGGLKWRRVSANTLPGLNRIRFLDNLVGYVAGDGTDQFGTGVFRTTDGGRSWKPLPGKSGPGWLSADFQDQHNGALAGAWGRLAVLRQDGLAAAEVDDLSGRTVCDVKVIGNRAVAVGQGGLILLSRDTPGARWSYADLKLSTEVRASLDFHAVSCVENDVWVVGRPGSVVLHSLDKGESWQVHRTAQPLPLNGVHFANGHCGWAVGELGSILNTQDGGKNWRVQRRGGQRTALLFVHGRQAALPVDTIGLLGGDEGYLCASLRAFACDPFSAAPAKATDPQRFAAAIRQVGGAAGESLWQFPIPQHLARANRGDLVRYWNGMHADRAGEEFLRQLVLAIRVWRPSVVITDSPDAKSSGWPGDAFLAETVVEAFKKAEDRQAFPEQLEDLGVETWKAEKLYGLWPASADAHICLPLTDVKARLEGTARDFATPAAALLAEFPVSLPNVRCYRLLASRLPGADSHKGLMQGVELAPGGVARRASAISMSLDPQIEKAIRARRNLQALAEMPASPLSDPNKLLAQVAPTIKVMPDRHGAIAVFELANQYVRLGQWSHAREMFLLLVDRYPAHPYCVDAYRWLIRHNSSSEVRRRQELSQFSIVSQSKIQLAGAGSSDASRLGPGVSSEALLLENVQSHQLTLLGQKQETLQWYQGCLELNDRLAALGPIFATEPSTQFCIQAARRHLGQFEEAKQWYTQFVASHADGPWRDAATAELWVMNRTGMPPRPVAQCRFASIRPFLDGDFSDACWQGVQPLVFRNASGDTLKEYPTEVRVAYDKDFLYLAIRCKHPPDRWVAPVKVRPQDADLRPYDRISLLLDIDRDYSTCFQLQVDQRGCVCEDCWGDRSWNPRWFVAIKSQPDCWQVEAAIPMIELTGDPVTVGHAWACNVTRVLPGRGVQAWSLPADVQPRPEGMGLLMFMRDSDRKR
jgi:photosystem II stability/assembly factor-like uncharacterized protein